MRTDKDLKDMFIKLADYEDYSTIKYDDFVEDIVNRVINKLKTKKKVEPKKQMKPKNVAIN